MQVEKLLVKYLEITLPGSYTNPDMEIVAEELEKRINALEYNLEATCICVNFLGESFAPIQGMHGDIRFSVPHDKLFKFMAYFRSTT